MGRGWGADRNSGAASDWAAEAGRLAVKRPTDEGALLAEPDVIEVVGWRDMDVDSTILVVLALKDPAMRLSASSTCVRVIGARGGTG